MELSQNNGESKQPDFLIYKRLENYIDIVQQPDLYTFCRMAGVSQDRIESGQTFKDLLIKLYKKQNEIANRRLGNIIGKDSRIDLSQLGCISTSASPYVVDYFKKYNSLYGEVEREQSFSPQQIKRGKKKKTLRQLVIFVISLIAAGILAYYIALYTAIYFHGQAVMP